MQHLLIKTKGSKERFTKTNDIRIDQEVQHAFKNFHKLRWINLKEDDFTNLPEFQRITRKFADYINHICLLYTSLSTPRRGYFIV